MIIATDFNWNKFRLFRSLNMKDNSEILIKEKGRRSYGNERVLIIKAGSQVQANVFNRHKIQ